MCCSQSGWVSGIGFTMVSPNCRCCKQCEDVSWWWMMYKETHETWDVSGFVYGPDRDKQYMTYEMKDVKLLIEFHCWHHENWTSRYSLDLVWAGCLRLDVIYRSLISMRWIKQIGHPWQMAFSRCGDESSWVVAAEWHLGFIAEMRS